MVGSGPGYVPKFLIHDRCTYTNLRSYVLSSRPSPSLPPSSLVVLVSVFGYFHGGDNPFLVLPLTPPRPPLGGPEKSSN